MENGKWIMKNGKWIIKNEAEKTKRFFSRIYLD
jgi:hypothetical protein